MNTQEVANKYVELLRKGAFDEVEKELYADNIVSLEPKGANIPERLEGIDAKLKKSQEFNDTVEEFHNNEVSDPIVAENFFSCTMNMDVTMKGFGRINMEEVCVFEVQNGKIVKEQFFFTPEPVPAAN